MTSTLATCTLYIVLPVGRSWYNTCIFDSTLATVYMSYGQKHLRGTTSRMKLFF